MVENKKSRMFDQVPAELRKELHRLRKVRVKLNYPKINPQRCVLMNLTRMACLEKISLMHVPS